LRSGRFDNKGRSIKGFFVRLDDRLINRRHLFKYLLC
jgi:hypothetical protein